MVRYSSLITVFGNFALYTFIEIPDFLEVTFLIVHCEKWFPYFDFLLAKIKSNHHNGYLGLFGNMIKTCSELFHFFSCSFGCQGKPEYVSGIENLDDAVHCIGFFRSIYWRSSRPPEKPTKGWFKKTLFANIVDFLVDDLPYQQPMKKSNQCVCGTTMTTHLSKSGKLPTSFHPSSLK